MENYSAKVVFQINPNSKLNVRDVPTKRGSVIDTLSADDVVTVIGEYDNGWKYVTYGNRGIGYVSGVYLERIDNDAGGDEADEIGSYDTENAADDTGKLSAYTSLIRSDGVSILLEGCWRVADD